MPKNKPLSPAEIRRTDTAPAPQFVSGDVVLVNPAAPPPAPMPEASPAPEEKKP